MTALRYAAVGETPPEDIMELLVVRPEVVVKDPHEDLSSLERARLALRTRTLSRNSGTNLFRSVSMGPRENTRTSLTQIEFDPMPGVGEDDPHGVGLPAVQRTSTLRFTQEPGAEDMHTFKVQVARNFDSNIRTRDPYELKIQYLKDKVDLVMMTLTAGGRLQARSNEREPKPSTARAPRLQKAMSFKKPVAKQAPIVSPAPGKKDRLLSPSQQQSSADLVTGYDEAEDDMYMENVPDEALGTISGFYKHMKEFLKQAEDAREAWEAKKKLQGDKRVAAHDRLAHSPRSKSRSIFAMPPAAAPQAKAQVARPGPAARRGGQHASSSKSAQHVNFSGQDSIHTMPSNASAKSARYVVFLPLLYIHVHPRSFPHTRVTDTVLLFSLYIHVLNAKQGEERRNGPAHEQLCSLTAKVPRSQHCTKVLLADGAPP